MAVIKYIAEDSPIFLLVMATLLFFSKNVLSLPPADSYWNDHPLWLWYTHQHASTTARVDCGHP